MWRSSLVTHHSSLLLEPFFPATFKDEDVFELRLVTQTARDFATGIAVQAAAINHNLFRRRPRRQKLRQQRIPAVLVQGESSGHMIVREIFVRARIDPDGTVAPRARLFHADYFRRRNRGAPRTFVVKIERLPDSGNKRKRRETERLADQCRLHRLLMAGAVVTRAVA